MAAVTIRSDSGVQEEEICHYFHRFPFYLPCKYLISLMTVKEDEALEERS